MTPNQPPSCRFITLHENTAHVRIYSILKTLYKLVPSGIFRNEQSGRHLQTYCGNDLRTVLTTGCCIIIGCLFYQIHRLNKNINDLYEGTKVRRTPILRIRIQLSSRIVIYIQNPSHILSSPQQS